MKTSERAYAVLTDKRFWAAEWVHSGHEGPCPHTHEGGTCRQLRIGLRVESGRVRWLAAETAEKAFEGAARVLLDGVAITSLAGYQG